MQKVDLYQPMINVNPAPSPLTVRVGMVPPSNMTQGGSMQSQQGISKIETYVLLSALPVDLQERIKLAVQTLVSGM